jgi:hypothetical protein
VLDRFARRIVRGTYRTATAALPVCRQALTKSGPAGLRTDGAILQALTARARALGRTPLGQRWTPAEAAIADRFARDLVRGKYARMGLAVTACRQELAAGGFPVRRTHPAVHYQLSERGQKMGWDPANPNFTPKENQVLDRFAQAVVGGRYRTSAEAAPDCRRELHRVRPEAIRSDTALATNLRGRVRAMGRVQTKNPWSGAEDRVISRYARLVALGRYDGAKQAAVECLAVVNRLRRRQAVRGASLPARTLVNVAGRLWRVLAKLGIPRAQALWSPAEVRVIDHYARAVIAHQYPSIEHAVEDCWSAVAQLDSSARTARLGAEGAQTVRARASVRAKIYERVRGIDHRQLPGRRWSVEERRSAEKWARRYDLHRRGRLRMGPDTMGRMMRAELGRLGYYRTDLACRAEILERRRHLVGIARQDGRVHRER